MLCPTCNRHRLLPADGKWFCPQCFQVYHSFPRYGIPSNKKGPI
ncbi:MAG TPA: hypothetical protein PLZ08_03010 [Bacillota bacterium]|nr:hypothetical protein [Bacillota bacterium]HOL08819.1 hypothetical protein [Bacillota bacterium]HPO96909.1 hypothetical protein [Bacillota bacterium]